MLCKIVKLKEVILLCGKSQTGKVSVTMKDKVLTRQEGEERWKRKSMFIPPVIFTCHNAALT